MQAVTLEALVINLTELPHNSIKSMWDRKCVHMVRWTARTMKEGYNPHLQQKILKLRNPEVTI